MLRSYRNITKSSPKELILAERLPIGRYESFGRHNGFGRNWNSPFSGLSVLAEREKTLSVVPYLRRHFFWSLQQVGTVLTSAHAHAMARSAAQVVLGLMDLWLQPRLTALTVSATTSTSAASGTGITNTAKPVRLYCKRRVQRAVP